MAFNPLQLMKMKSAWETFAANHPKFPMFMQAVSREGIQEGTVIEVNITTPEGKVLSTNLKVTQSDLELFETIKSMQ